MMLKEDQSLYFNIVQKELQNDGNICSERMYSGTNSTTKQDQLSNRKVPGADGIPTELLKVAEEEVAEVLTVLCQHISNKITWENVHLFMPKKENARNCIYYLTVALTPYISNVFLRILQGLAPSMKQNYQMNKPLLERQINTTPNS